MKHLKRIFAFLGVILLAGMYICTLVFVLIGSPLADNLFKKPPFCVHCLSLSFCMGIP